MIEIVRDPLFAATNMLVDLGYSVNGTAKAVTKAITVKAEIYTANKAKYIKEEAEETEKRIISNRLEVRKMLKNADLTDEEKKVILKGLSWGLPSSQPNKK